MRNKTLAIILAIAMLSIIGTACTKAEKQGMDMPVMTGMDMSSPDSTKATLAPTLSPSPKVTSTPSASPHAEVNTAAPTPKASPAATPAKLKTPAKTGDLAPVSWYYMKKGKGKVPNFPPETKTFTASQKAIWVGTGKKVYLTFDNGGPMGDTKKLLQVLKDNNVKASFFIAGYNLKANPDFFRQVTADGHLVANHTMTHKDMTTLTDEQFKKEITDFEKLYKDITGHDLPKYFRFPYGIYSKHLLTLVSDMGYTSVFWSTAMKDWVPRKNGADDTYNDIMGNLHDGNVILMHQGSTENIDALDRIIKAIKQAGYSFGLVDEISPA
jgi:peptidoglycan-N-acetylmuramic acid deacetylase